MCRGYTYLLFKASLLNDSSYASDLQLRHVNSLVFFRRVSRFFGENAFKNGDL